VHNPSFIHHHIHHLIISIFHFNITIVFQHMFTIIKHTKKMNKLSMIPKSIYITIILLLSTQISTIHAFKSQKKAITINIKNHYEAAVSAQSKCILNKNSSTIVGGEVLLSVMEPFPTAALAVSICCDGHYHN
jgi:hypothetical protein